MRQLLTSVVYSTDEAVIRKVEAYGGDYLKVSHVRTPGEFHRTVEQRHPAVAIIDHRAGVAGELIRNFIPQRADIVFMILAEPHSDAWEEALEAGAFGITDIDADGKHLQSDIRQACRQATLSQENQTLRAKLQAALRQNATTAPVAPRHLESNLSLRQIFSPLRHFEDVDSLLQGIVDNVAGATSVLRVGMFARMDEQEPYRLMAGVGCLDGTRTIEFDRDDFLVRWLEANAQLVTRENLNLIDDIGERLHLEGALDAMGAELIAPLQRRTGVLGWLFVGRRATGTAFAVADMQDVMAFADHATTTLENVLLFQEIARQKSFAETLLHSLPMGIVAVNLEGRVDWFNEAAERLLLLHREDVLGKPARSLGTRLSQALNLSLHGREDAVAEWLEERSNLHLSVRTVRLISADFCWGSVAFVYDLTRERLLARKQQEVERASFWTELAASMSHEIRNPLVAIKTFAQLLPERYAESEFRDEFSKLVTQEVDRLDAIIRQINRFASLPPPEKAILNLKEVLTEGETQARAMQPKSPARILMDLPAAPPPIRGDKRALAQGIANIFANAMEAMEGRKSQNITLTVRTVNPSPVANAAIQIEITDEGGGIPPDIRANVFSPFCTTKARAMGLGLAIVQRTLADHDGHVDVTSSNKGTCVRLTLPIADQPTDQSRVFEAAREAI